MELALFVIVAIAVISVLAVASYFAGAAINELPTVQEPRGSKERIAMLLDIREHEQKVSAKQKMLR